MNYTINFKIDKADIMLDFEAQDNDEAWEKVNKVLGRFEGIIEEKDVDLYKEVRHEGIRF